MSDELKKYINDQFETLRQETLDAFSAARERIIDAHQITKHTHLNTYS
jgi:hypothetical protein